MEKQTYVRIFRYVPLASADDHCRLGWMATEALRGTVHEAYCVMMEWRCACGRELTEARRT